jgi:P-type conjugative transfer protein TrbJ
MLSGLSGEFRRLAGLQRQMRLQRGDAQALERVYQDMYPGASIMSGQSNDEYQRRWSAWSQESDRAYQAAFQTTGRQLQDLENSDAFDAHVQQLLQTPEGRMEAMQAANQLAAMQLQEAREMRSLMNVYIQAQIQAASKAEQDAQAQREADKRIMAKEKFKELENVKSVNERR